MVHIYPILFIDLLKQSPYKNVILLSIMHKQKTYFSKKYSKSNRITLDHTTKKYTNDNIKAIKYAHKNRTFIDLNYIKKSTTNYKIIRYIANNNTAHVLYRHKIINQLLVRASICGNTKTIKLLLDNPRIQTKKQKINRIWYYNNLINIHCKINSALRNSVKNNHTKIVKLLLTHGTDIQMSDNSLLKVSAKHGFVKMTKLLLDNGANIHAENDYAVRISAEHGHVEVVKLLLDYGANIYVRHDYALQESAHNGHTKVVELLLDRSLYTFNELTLEYCIRYCPIDIIKLLLDRGYDVNVRNNIALRTSVKYGLVDIIKLLLERGATIHANNILSISVANNNVKMTKLLLDQGANIHTIDNQTLTNCIFGFKKEMTNLLFDYGMDVYGLDEHTRGLLAITVGPKKASKKIIRDLPTFIFYDIYHTFYFP